MTTTLAALKERYSVLLTLNQLSEILDRSPDGLRISLSKSRADWARHINAAKVHIGRRIYFRADAIAQLIDKQPIACDQGEQQFPAITAQAHAFHSMIETGDMARMGPYAVTVYLVIMAHASLDTGRSFPAIDTISNESGISRSQVIRELKTLEAFGYITINREGRSNEYRLRLEDAP